jgi:hypothetical protein
MIEPRWKERIKEQYPNYMVVYPYVLNYKTIESHFRRTKQVTDVYKSS